MGDVTVQVVLVLSRREAAMVYNAQRQSYDVVDDPAPAVASDAEIAIAEKLRHRLEERYLGQTADPPAIEEGTSEDDR
jgi:hypothetical protein